MMDRLPSIEEMYGTKRRLSESAAIDKQDLILRALATLLRERAGNLPRENPHCERMTRLITEIDGVVR